MSTALRCLPRSRGSAFRPAHVLAANLGLLVLLWGRIAAAQGTISGRVADAETQQPVSDVLVDVITGSRERVAAGRSEEQGQFQIAGVQAGVYSLVFSRLGYELRRVDGIRVAAEPVDVGVIAIVSRALRMNPVVVTPSRVEEKAVKAPASTWVVDERDIKSRPATTVVDHVRSVPGVDVASTGLTQSNVVARGFNNVFSGALMVLTDYRWASVPSLRFNAYNLIPTADEDIDRIEFVLGPGSALYGPNVSQGVMHMITRSPLQHRGTTLSAMAGERELFQASGRHAGGVGSGFGYKLSGSYMRGRDWEYHDPVEDSRRAQAIAAGADPDTLLIGARDFDVERFTGDGRLDFKLGEQSNLILAGGLSQLGSSIELTGIGAAQAKDWRNSYAQARFRHQRLFAQSYVNFSDAGDSYTLRDGGRIVDKSILFASQVQHESRLWERQRFIYGLDFIQTVPRTEGTINGRFEDDDDVTEFGGYVQSETNLTSKLDLVAAARLDHHSKIDDEVFSPRAGLIFKVADGQNVRATYNRAFNQPSSNNLFLDIRSAQDLGGLPFDVRVSGVPEEGFHFGRDANGVPLMRSPFTPAPFGGPSQQLPLDATVFWDVVVQIMQAQGVDLSGLPPPTSAEVGTVMRSLNPTNRSFNTVSDVSDVEPLRPQITNTLEAGYKGFFANRASFGVDVHYSRIEDFVSPLLVTTPSVFLDRASLFAYFMANGMSAAQAAQLAAAIAGIDGNASVTGIPLGTVTPINFVGDPYDVFLTYRNFGEVHVWGVDLGSTFFVNDQLSFSGSYSFVNRNFFENLDGVADVALNAPKNKAKLAANYRNDRTGLSLELRGRYVDAFPVNSGVFVGRVEAYTLMDANISYALPFSRSTEVALSGTNVFDERHREFVGAPELGRLVVLRVRQSL